MTDDDLRELGRKFIADRRSLYSLIEHNHEPGWADAEFKRDWDFIDPLRMGIYVAVKAEEGPWAIRMPAIQNVCRNTAAFIKAPPAEAARIREFQDAEAPAIDN